MIALVSCDAVPEVHPHDRPLWDALVRRNLTPKVVSWSDPGFDWAAPRLCLLRSTWDYFKQRERFLAWARQVPRLWNPAQVVAWNSHKGYLAELSARGIPVVETAALARGSRVDLAAVARARGWTDVVVKPAVSGGAWRTFVARAGDHRAKQVELDGYLAEQDMLVQPFLRHLGERGEVSLVHLGGELTHTVARSPGLDSPGVPPLRLERREASPQERALAERAIAASGQDPAYVRVDLTWDDGGALVVLELEMIEPNLFLHLAPDAAERFAAQIAAAATA